MSLKLTYRLFAAFTLVLPLSGLQATSANPDIKDESIKVLINHKTSCNQQGLIREVTEDNGLRFTIECSDKAFYPDGLVVLCPVRDVDMSCTVMTQPQEFKYLNLIYGPMSDRVHESDDREEK